MEAGESAPLEPLSAGQAKRAPKLANCKLQTAINGHQHATNQATRDTCIAPGYKHRLYNSSEAMYVIELHYPREDDIVRIHDQHGRA